MTPLWAPATEQRWDVAIPYVMNSPICRGSFERVHRKVVRPPVRARNGHDRALPVVGSRHGESLTTIDRAKASSPSFSGASTAPCLPILKCAAEYRSGCIGLARWSRCCAACRSLARGAVLCAVISAEMNRLLAAQACGCRRASLFPRLPGHRGNLPGPGATVSGAGGHGSIMLVGCGRDAGTVR